MITYFAKKWRPETTIKNGAEPEKPNRVGRIVKKIDII
jgi:hypothetical protein